MIKAFIDTESTDLPLYKERSEHPDQPRMIQFGMVVMNGDEVIEEIELLVKPDGWVVPPNITELTGITTEMCEAHGVPIEQVYAEFLTAADAGAVFFAHGKNHDKKIMKIEAVRLGHEDLPANDWRCTMVESRTTVQAPNVGKKGFKMPTLGEAYAHFTGKQLENAHTALADAKACMIIHNGMEAI